MKASLITTYRNCPCCRNNQSYAIKKLEYRLFDGHPLPPTMELVGCSACGFVYYDGEFDNGDLELFYRKHYYVNAYQLRAEHPAEKEYNENSIDVLLNNNIDFSSSVVDVGCGPGHLLKQMRRRGFSDLTGVELNESYINELNAYGIKAYLGSSEQLPLPGKVKIDCFIYKNIFEHLFTLQETLNEIVRTIKAGGHILVEVPNAQAYDHSEQYHPLHYFTLEHINHFDLSHLEALFRLYGFKAVDSGTRMLDIAEKFPVPIMYCLFRHEVVVKEPIQADFELIKTALNWFNFAEDFDKPELKRLKVSGKSVYLWGLSYRTLMQYAMSPLKDCSVKYYVDSDQRKQGLKIGGKSIISPDILKNAGKDEAVVIGVGPSSGKMQQILSEMGFAGEVVILN